MEDNFNINISNLIPESLKKTIESATKISETLSEYQFNPKYVAAFEALNNATLMTISESFRNAASRLNDVLCRAVPSPFIEWINAVEYSPLWKLFESIKIDDEKVKRQKELHRAYLQLMYDCEWFPYAGIVADTTLFYEINGIIASSKGNSKRRKARIDKAILSYYGSKEMKDIKKMWRDSDLESHIKKMLGQAIEAHLRGEYVLTITCLATMWEGLIHYRTNITERRQSSKTNKDLVKLIEKNDYEPIFSDYYRNFIVSQVNTKEDVIEGVPNRNGISHSKYNKYPNKKASLNAILLTDFIIGLTPKEVEEKE